VDFEVSGRICFGGGEFLVFWFFDSVCFFLFPGPKGRKKTGVLKGFLGYMWWWVLFVCFFLFPGPKGRKKTGVLKGILGLYVVMGCVIGLVFLFSS